jgi:hypothetical protein
MSTEQVCPRCDAVLRAPTIFSSELDLPFGGTCPAESG